MARSSNLNHSCNGTTGSRRGYNLLGWANGWRRGIESHEDGGHLEDQATGGQEIHEHGVGSHPEAATHPFPGR